MIDYNKKYKRVLFAIFTCCAGILLLFDNDNSDYSRQVERISRLNFHGIVNKIEYPKENRGIPDITVDSSKIYIGVIAEFVSEYLKISDSIAKDSNSVVFRVYRKNCNGIWEQKRFDVTLSKRKKGVHCITINKKFAMPL